MRQSAGASLQIFGVEYQAHNNYNSTDSVNKLGLKGYHIYEITKNPE